MRERGATMEPRLAMGIATMAGQLYVFGGVAGLGQCSRP